MEAPRILSRPSLAVFQRPSHRGGRNSHIVCKFGGTSVAKHLPSIVDEIVPSLKHCIPILVCSAQSYTVKAEGTTQCLFDSIDAALGVGKFAPEAAALDNGEVEAKGVRDGEHVSAGVGVARQTLVDDASTKLATVEEESDSRTSSFSSTGSTSNGSVGSPNESLFLGSDAGYSSTTSLQSSLAGLGLKSSLGHAQEIMAGVLERHLAAARVIIPNGGPILRALQSELRADCDQVLRWLAAVSTLGEISPRIRDSIIATGEVLACRTVVAALKSRNVDARLLRLDDVCTDRPALARINNGEQLDGTYWDELCLVLRERIVALSAPAVAVDADAPRPVLVATGFFGPVPGSLLNQVGRGYSDVCAALCARAIAAQELQIWKEVDGVFTADPRKIVNSKLLKEISRNQAKLLTSYGSEVVHPLAIDQAMRLNIHIVVKNVSKPTASGTRVVPSPSLARRQSTSGFPASTFAVTLLDHLDMVHVHFDNWELSPGRATGIVMELIKEHTGVSNVIGMDLTASSQRDVCFMLSSQVGRSVAAEEGLRRTLEGLQKLATVTVTPGLSYLQIVYMSPPHTAAGIACRAFGALDAAGIEVKMINYGPMDQGIGCVIHDTDASRAGGIVHDALLEAVPSS